MIRTRSLRARLAVYFGAAVAATSPFYAGAAALAFYLHERDEAAHPSASPSHDEAAEMRTLLMGMALVLGLTAPFVVLAASGAGIWIARRAVAPLRDAADRARRARNGDGEVLLPVRGDDEDWDALASAMNDLLESKRRSMAEMKAFSANAAHELRTPLTAMLGDVQVALRRERDGAEYREVLHRVEGEVSRLGALVNALLTLARVDSGAISVNALIFDVNEVVGDVVEAAARRARSRDASVRLESRSSRAMGDPVMTRRILENLVDNALLHGGPDIRVLVSTHGGRAVVCVEDDGEGLAPEVRDRVFERFNRLPGSGEGFGLGLAIAHALAEAQQGALRHEPHPALTRFVLELPAPTTEGSAHEASEATAPHE